MSAEALGRAGFGRGSFPPVPSSFAGEVAENGRLIGSAALAAFAGALLGNRLVKK